MIDARHRALLRSFHMKETPQQEYERVKAGIVALTARIARENAGKPPLWFLTPHYHKVKK